MIPTFSSSPRVVSRSIITIRGFWLATLSSAMDYFLQPIRNRTFALAFSKKSSPSSSSLESRRFTLRYSSLGLRSLTRFDGTLLELYDCVLGADEREGTVTMGTHLFSSSFAAGGKRMPIREREEEKEPSRYMS